MNKGVGYIISIAGLAIMAISFGIVPLKIAALENFPTYYITIAGIIIIIVGVVMSLNTKKSGSKKTKNKNDGHDEIPIYQGTGKNRKVIGYRRD